MKTAVAWTKWAAECAAVACIVPACLLLRVPFAFPKPPVKVESDRGRI